MSPFDYTPAAVAADFGAVHMAIEWEQRAIRLFGREVPLPRMTAMYGRGYTYSGIDHAPRQLPPVLSAIRRRVIDATGVPFNSVLCNLYRDGSDSVSWHSDDDYNGRGEIASVSLGAPRRFLVRRKDKADRKAYTLEHGSLLMMADGAQSEWEHSVPKTKRHVGERINLTFRCIQ